MTFHKYIKIRPIGYEENKDIFLDPEDDIVIEEKIDGANFRFMIKDGQIIFGSRTQELEEGKDHKYEKNFRRSINYLTEKFAKMDKEDIKEAEGLIFYGENCVPHSLEYNWEKIPAFLGFDIYNNKEEKFLDYEPIKWIFEEVFDLTMVPLIKTCKAKEIKEITDKDIPKSYYANSPAEGIVLKNYSKQIFAKYVSDKFKEVNRNTFGKSKKFAKDDSEYVLATYCTNARIDKIVFKLIDMGEKLEMTMMHKLPNAVYKDIWEENWQEISNFKRTIDLKKLKQGVSKRCLMVLRQMISNNAFEKGKK